MLPPRAPPPPSSAMQVVRVSPRRRRSADRRGGSPVPRGARKRSLRLRSPAPARCRPVRRADPRQVANTARDCIPASAWHLPMNPVPMRPTPQRFHESPCGWGGCQCGEAALRCAHPSIGARRRASAARNLLQPAPESGAGAGGATEAVTSWKPLWRRLPCGDTAVLSGVK